MAARAIWKGRIILGKLKVPVKLYSAVQDRAVHFHLLHARDLTPVKQRIVRKSDGREVPRDEQLKAFPLDKETGVIVRPGELAEMQPAESRDIDLCRFVRRELLGDEWFDRPYYLGPEKESKTCFAIAGALSRKDVIGIARWVMRKQPYLGALTAMDGHLMLITLRRAEQILAVSKFDVPKTKKPEANEIRLAKQLVAAISGDFEPDLWGKDEYRERLEELIRAKSRGKTIRLAKSRRKRATGDLAQALQASLKGARERKVA